MQIGEVSKLMDINISTLRYYDKQGLLQNVKRTISGIRNFDEQDIDALRIINCLKKSGMQIKDIKQFMDWCQEGDSTLEDRLNMFYEREQAILNQIDELKRDLDLVRYKVWYYETATKDGTEQNVKNMKIEEYPEEIQDLYKNREFEIFSVNNFYDNFYVGIGLLN